MKRVYRVDKGIDSTNSLAGCLNLGQFSQETIGNVFKIKCPAQLDAVAAKDFADQSKAWMMSSAAYYVLDFSNVVFVGRDFYRATIQFKAVIKPDGKQIRIWNCSDAVMKMLKADGVDACLVPVTSIDELQNSKSASLSKSSELHAELLKVFLKATKITFETQCHTPLQMMKPYPKKEEVQGTSIVAVMPLISNGWSGNFSLCLSTPVFLRVYENMFGEKHTAINAEMEDAAAEFVNIIYGAAKTELNPKGHNFQPALPKVLFGENLKLRRSGTNPAVVVPFGTDAGQFHIEVEFEK